MKIFSLHKIRPVLTAILTGFLCNCIWLYEILQSKGWYGLQWLGGYMVSVLIIIPIIVFSFVYSINLSKKLNIKTLLIAIIGLSSISLISFEIARTVLYSIYSRFFFFGLSLFVSILIVLVAVMIPVLIFSFGYYTLIKRIPRGLPRVVWRKV